MPLFARQAALLAFGALWFLAPSSRLDAALILAPTPAPASASPAASGAATASAEGTPTTAALPSPTASPSPPLPTGIPSHVSFFASRTVLWLGCSAVLPFGLNHPAQGDETFPLSTSDSGLVEILRPPVVLAGETTGFLRLRARRPGHLRLLVHGEAPLDVDIKPDPAAAPFARLDVESPRPRIVSPAPDAYVWGGFSVGVEVFDDSSTSATDPRLQLRLPNGQLLDPVSHTTPEQGPARHYQFNVPADFPPGRARFVAVSSPAGFSDVDRLSKAPGSHYESDPLELNVIAPHAAQLWGGECENPAFFGPTKEVLGPARPPHFGSRQPNVVPDPAASGGQTVACPGSDPAWCLPVILKEPGAYQLLIQTRGDFGVGAFPTAALYLDNAEVPTGTVRLAGPRYHRLPVGTPLHLDAGPQFLTVRFANDANVGKEDRNLYLDRYELVRIGAALPLPLPSASPVTAFVPAAGSTPFQVESTAPPEFQPTVLYPANGAPVYGADAVVVRVAGGNEVVRPSWVDLLVDGQPQGVRTPSFSPATPILLPLVARQLAPGVHRLTVRAADRSGRTFDSPTQLLNVLPAPPAIRGPYERAVYLLDRLAFGPDPRELIAVLTQGESAWLNARLTEPFDNPAELVALRQAAQQFPRIDDNTQTVHRVLSQWIDTANPVRARFTAWAENHFSTWIQKVKAAPQWRQHLAFSHLGVAPFADLLDLSAHTPAMLVYLDQEKSYAKKLNENYAREIMELHTLGVHGGYAQEDVTTLAEVFNGWTLSQEGVLPADNDDLPFTYNNNNEAALTGVFRFDPLLNDGKARRVFGLDFPATADPAARYDQVRLVLEMLASHPHTAEHIGRQLAEHYVGAPAPDALVHTLAQTYLENGGDLRPVLRTLVASPAFWNAPPKMATPLDYGLRIARLCRAAVCDLGGKSDQSPKPEQVDNFLKKSGMGLFERVTPDGYPENSAAYMDSNALLQRWHFMESILDPLNRLVPKDWRTPPPPAVVPAANEAPGLPSPPSSGSPQDDANQRFIDLAAVRLTGRLLSPGSNDAARELLAAGTPDQMRQTLLLISLLPETSLR